MSIEEKKQRIQPKNSKLSIQRQCELIGLPRSSYYREGLAGQETPTNLEFMRLIDNEYTAHPFYGTRQIRNALKRKGHKINRKRKFAFEILLRMEKTVLHLHWLNPTTSLYQKKYKS